MAYATETRTTTAAEGLRFGAIRAAIADRLAKYKLYRQTLDELAALNDRELADLGLSRGMIRGVAQEAAYGK